MINLAIANEFMNNFAGRNIYVSMKDDNSAPPAHFHREFSACNGALVKRNEDMDCGIFFTVNELDKSLDPERKRTGKMWVRGRALFLDDDNPRSEPRSDFALIPNLIVSTSSGKYHYYWLIEGGIDDKEQYLEVQKSLVGMYNGDGNVKDVTRYLRLPGFMHRKTKNGEVNDRVVTYTDSGLPKYKFEELRNEFYSKNNNNTGSKSSRNSGSDSSDMGGSGSDDVVGGRSRSGNQDGESYDGSKSIDESTNEIINGINYHENLVSLSFQMMKEGVKEVYIRMALKGIMESVPENIRDERWSSRFGDLDRIIRGAFERESAENIDLNNIKKKKDEVGSNIPWPPGLMGDLCSDAYNMARYQYKEVAIVSAIGLVAGVAGRKFNISDTGLNVYLTLIMGTGMGKDSIGKFINRSLLGLNDSGTASSFIGAKRFTGPKAVINHLKDARSRVCVFTEAGILMRSSAGDGDGLTRLLLGLYTSSGQYDFSGSEEFSSAEGRIDSIRSPALTIINEATPETLLEAFQDSGSLENGHLPRQSVFRVQGDKPYPNKKIQKNLSKNVQLRLSDIVKKCSIIQSADKFDCWEFEFSEDIEDEVYEFQDKCVDMENKHRGEDNVKSIMISRMYMKAIKFAAICSVVNKGDRDHSSEIDDRLLISRPEWEWGLSLAEYEFESIDNMFSGHGNNAVEDLAIGAVKNAVIKLLRDKYKSSNVRLSRIQMQKQEVPYYNLYQIFRRNTKFSKINRFSDNPADGLKVVLDHMIAAGYLRVVYKGGVKSNHSDDQSHTNFKRYGVNIYKPTNLLMSVE